LDLAGRSPLRLESSARPVLRAGILLKWVTARFIWNKLHKNMPRIDHFFHD
jgi:hypothetical protein